MSNSLTIIQNNVSCMTWGSEASVDLLAICTWDAHVFFLFNRKIYICKYETKLFTDHAFEIIQTIPIECNKEMQYPLSICFKEVTYF